jgi:hypothetical protein
MADKNVVLDRRSELIMLRDVVVRIHSLATGRYVEPDSELRARIGRLCDAAIDASPELAGFLGRIHDGGSNALEDGLLDGPDRVTAEKVAHG